MRYVEWYDVSKTKFGIKEFEHLESLSVSYKILAEELKKRNIKAENMMILGDDIGIIPKDKFSEKFLSKKADERGIRCYKKNTKIYQSLYGSIKDHYVRAPFIFDLVMPHGRIWVTTLIDNLEKIIIIGIDAPDGFNFYDEDDKIVKLTEEEVAKFRAEREERNKKYEEDK